MYLIRHAEAEGNIYRVFQGQRDTLLTATGKVQTRALEERFRDIHVDAVYSSDLYRAAATAAAICRVKGLPLERRTALREICVGTCEGRAVGDVHREQELERIRSGGLYLEDSISLSEIERLTEEGRIGEKIIPVEEMFLDLLRVRTGSGADKKLRNGNALSPSELGLQSPGENRTRQAENLSVIRIPEEYLPERLRVCDSSGNFLAIYRYDPSGGSYRPDLMFL
jgi:tRNA U55 pseudouridine synthase TruB